MIIKKLIVRGDSYQRTLEFSNELNIISGEKTSGKSLVLSLIDYCLGKTSRISLKVQTELEKYVDFIFLEIKIDEDIFTISRGIKKMLLYFGFTTLNLKISMNLFPKNVIRNTYKAS